MNNLSPIVLKPKKGRSLLFLIAFLALAWLGCYLSLFETQVDSSAWVGALISFLMAAPILWYLYKTNPFKASVIISTEGINLVYLKNKKLILWNDIQSLEKFTQLVPQVSKAAFIPLKQEYLVIYTEPKDPNYNESGYGQNRMKNILMRLDKNLYVPSIYLPYKVDKVIALIHDYKMRLGSAV
jgi:hypothetical protein